jgi:hypothetical protein
MVQALLPAGATLGGYRIKAVLGSGGMGVVYEATQLSLERTVALKVIAPHLSQDAAFRERFSREAMLQAALEHPNVVTVYEAGESEASLFLAMRLVQGSDLKRMLAHGPLEPPRALALLEQIASALDAAHESGLVHRDVKPQNILVDDQDRAFLSDFGLIKRPGEGTTGTGGHLGSLDYVPPEQIRGEPLSPASDVYALTAVLYESLVGAVPFPRDAEAAVLYAHLADPAPRVTEGRPDLPRGLDDVIARGLAKSPADRPPSAGGLIAEAEAELSRDSAFESSGEPVGEPMPGQAPTSAAPPPAVRGETRGAFGDTIVDPAVFAQAPVIELEPERRLSRLVIAGLAAVVIAAAAGGYLLGHAREKVDRSAAGVAVVGPLSIGFPTDDWAPALQVTQISGLGLTERIALASQRGDAPGELVAGIVARAEGPLLLPRAVTDGLERPARRERVRLGAVEALRFRDLRLERLSEPVTIYAVPTSAGAATIACLTPIGPARDTVLAACESIATTIALRGVRVLPLGADPRYADHARHTLGLLNAKRTRGRGALLASRTRVEQARAAGELSGAFATARADLAKGRPGPMEAPAHRSILAALARTEARYRELAGASLANDRRVYNRTASRVRRAELELGRAVQALARLV